MKKTKLFIDIDGVLFAIYGNPPILQLRPFVASFIEWASRNFDAFWLTAWRPEQIEQLRNATYGMGPTISYAEWERRKTEAIDELASDGNFFWLDDDPYLSDISFLQGRGWNDKLIWVFPHGINGLNEAIKILCERTKIELPSWMIEIEDKQKDVLPELLEETDKLDLYE